MLQPMRLFTMAASIIASLAVATVASAHAEPASVSPGDGAVLTTPPRSVTITMTQEMARQGSANDIDVIGPAGTEVTSEAATILVEDRRVLSVNLPASLAPGDYVVRWSTLSADDGDSASGETRFRFDPNGTPAPGKEVLKESIVRGESPTPPAFSALVDGDREGTSWVLVVAVGAAAAVIGAGAMYLVGPRRA